LNAATDFLTAVASGRVTKKTPRAKKTTVVKQEAADDDDAMVDSVAEDST
jgi:hypothetical protein